MVEEGDRCIGVAVACNRSPQDFCHKDDPTKCKLQLQSLEHVLSELPRKNIHFITNFIFKKDEQCF